MTWFGKPIPRRPLLSHQRHRALPASLRERGEDIALLAKHFLAKRIEEEKRPPQEFTKDALELISHYPWPGNVREMENIIEQAFIWSKGSQVITPEHLQYPTNRYPLEFAS